MEYDRALYRVYERAMEDLIATTSIFASDTGDDDNIGNNDWMTQRRPRNTNDNVIPFLWPILIHKYITAANSIYAGGGWRRSLNFASGIHLPWRIFRRRRNFTRLSGQDEEEAGSGDESYDNGGDGMNDVEMATLPSSRNTQGLRRRNPSYDSAGSNNSSRSGSSAGNRRRSRTVMSQDTSTTGQSGSSNSDSESTHSSQSDSNASREGRQGTNPRTDEENNTAAGDAAATSNNNPTITPISQMAQQIAMAQRQRFREQAEGRRPQSGGCTQRGLYTMMRISMAFAIWHLFVLGCLHYTYVGPRISKHVSLQEIDGIGEGEIVKSTCLENALKTRPVEERSLFFAKFGEKVKEEGEEGDEEDENEYQKEMDGVENSTQSSNATTSPPLLGRDEILQIKIIYGNDCAGCSKVRNVTIPSIDVAGNITNATEMVGSLRRSGESKTGQSSSTENADGQKNATIETDRYSTVDYWKENVYKFSTNEALMYLDDKLLYWHNVSIVNVTLTERCLNTGSDDGEYSFMSKFAQSMAQVYGMDSVIINQFMYSIKTTDGKYRSGHLQKMETKERWMYTKSELEESYEVRHNIIFWIFNRIGVMALSLVAFFLVTSVTALIVRELTSAGVMIMFPIFASLRAYGVPGASDRVLEVSYPWIGRARRAIRRRGLHPFNHYVWAHLAKLFLMYTLYESSQLAWSTMLYGKSTPANLPLWIFGKAMVYEYFSMIFVRSALSAYFYPRMTLLYFLGYHIYFYSVPYGFFDVALIPWVLLMVHAMIFTVIALEVPASSRGAVSVESPREVFAKLSWPEWSANIPAEWTLFLPLNSRYIPIYDRNEGGTQAMEEQDNGGDDAIGEDGETSDE